MKRILNLNGIGWHLMTAAGLFALGLPGLLWVLRAAGFQVNLLTRLMRLSVGIGIGLLVVLLVLIVVEQVQDGYLFRRYLKERRAKLALTDGRYECQYCGFRQVRAEDSCCPACGQGFSNPSDPL
jgi:hypothetical protein